MRALDKLRRRFIGEHGAAKTARAEALALLTCARLVLENAIRRRETAERAFFSARQTAEEMPAGWRDDDPCRPWPGRWTVYTWRALERLADAQATELEWFQVVEAQLANAAAAGDALEAERARS